MFKTHKVNLSRELSKSTKICFKSTTRHINMNTIKVIRLCFRHYFSFILTVHNERKKNDRFKGKRKKNVMKERKF